MGLAKRVPYRKQAILDAARDEPCTLNSPVCNGKKETTVFCHLNEGFIGKGGAQKADDFFGFFGCSGCHDLYDRRIEVPEEWKQYEHWHLLRAVYLTQRRLFEKGVIK